MNDYSTIKNPNTLIEIQIGKLWELEKKLKAAELLIKVQAKKLNTKK